MALPLAGAECVAVGGDRITARDLAKAVPALESVAGGVVFGYSPLPGATRQIPFAEIRRFAGLRGLTLESGAPVCVTFTVRVLSEAEVLEALRTSVPDPSAEIALLDYSRAGVPEGKLTFDIRRAVQGREPGVLHVPGAVQYAEHRSAAAWARARITVEQNAIIAIRNLTAGQELTGADWKVVPRRAPYGAERCPEAATLDGARVRRRIASGSPLHLSDVMPAQVIRQGDVVEVAARSGRALVQVAARALGGATAGQRVRLINEATGRAFTAVATGRGAAYTDGRSAR